MPSTAPTPARHAWHSPEYHHATQSSVRERVRFIEHHGKHILLSDFSHSDPELGKAICASVFHIVQQQAPHSVRSLLLLDNLYFDNDLIAVGKEVSKRDKPFVMKTAVVGLSGMLYILFQTILKFSQRDMQCFGTREEALDWLAED